MTVAEEPSLEPLSKPLRGLVDLICAELALRFGTMTAQLEVDYHDGEPSMIRVYGVERLHRLR